MKFSIVTINLNSAKDLGRTIESVIQQDCAEFEFLVFDGGSSDASEAILSLYRGRLDAVHRIKDAGVYSAMRQALDHCTGEYVLFMNAGDCFHSRKTLSRVVEAIEGSPDIVYGDHIYSHRGESFLHQSMCFDDIMQRLEAGAFDHLTHGKVPCHQATFTRVTLLQALSYDPNYHICADHEFMLRAYSRGASFQYVNEIVCIYAGGGFSAQRHKRLELELSSAYREYSYTPDRVDVMFGVVPRALSPYNSLTGLPLSGLGPSEGPFPDAGLEDVLQWSEEAGVSLLSSRRRSRGLHLRGLNPIEGQALTVIADGAVLARASIPFGSFSVDLMFDRDLAPMSVIEVEPDQAKALAASDSRISGFAVMRFRFIPVPKPQRKSGRGERLEIETSATRCQEVLSRGWSHVEASGVWSDGDDADLRFLLKPDVRRIVLTGYYNPYVAPELRKLLISIAGAPGAVHSVEGRKEIVLELPPSSHDDFLEVNLKPLEIAKAGEDKRRLGFFLERVHFA